MSSIFYTRLIFGKWFRWQYGHKLFLSYKGNQKAKCSGVSVTKQVSARPLLSTSYVKDFGPQSNGVQLELLSRT
jgi:hypothetical protein